VSFVILDKVETYGFLLADMEAQKYIGAAAYLKENIYFFPVINMVYWPARDGSLTCEKAKQSAALNNDQLLSIEITLDAIAAWNPANTRISSDNCFDLLGQIPRALNPPKVYPAATDGYWVMLKPLSKGTHTLSFKAQYNRENGAFSKMAQDIEYELLIE
jgi:hypothetical protein